MSFDVNWLAVLAAAVSAFMLGGIWYGPLFKQAWMRSRTAIRPGLATTSPIIKTFIVVYRGEYKKDRESRSRSAVFLAGGRSASVVPKP